MNRESLPKLAFHSQPSCYFSHELYKFAPTCVFPPAEKKIMSNNNNKWKLHKTMFHIKIITNIKSKVNSKWVSNVHSPLSTLVATLLAAWQGCRVVKRLLIPDHQKIRSKKRLIREMKSSKCTAGGSTVAPVTRSAAVMKSTSYFELNGINTQLSRIKV